MLPRLVRQPPGSSLCGQACIAMVADCSLREAIEAVGHSKVRGTYTREVVAALQRLGIQCATRLKRPSRSRPVLPSRYIASFHRPPVPSEGRRGKGHWVLIWDGVFLDPEGGRVEDYANWKMTSYLELFT